MAITFEDLKKVNKDIKTKNIKGKDYAEVNERITAFRKLFPEGFITTNVISHENGLIVMGASVGYYLEDGSMHVLGTGTAYEKSGSSQINNTSYIENCETSAVGRALGMAGFGLVASIATAEEVANAIYQQNQAAPNTAPQAVKKATPKTRVVASFFKCANCGSNFTDAALANKTKAKWGKYICQNCIDAKMAAYNKTKNVAPDPEPVPPPIPEEYADLPFPLD